MESTQLAHWIEEIAEYSVILGYSAHEKKSMMSLAWRPGRHATAIMQLVRRGCEDVGDAVRLCKGITSLVSQAHCNSKCAPPKYFITTSQKVELQDDTRPTNLFCNSFPLKGSTFLSNARPLWVMRYVTLRVRIIRSLIPLVQAGGHGVPLKKKIASFAFHFFAVYYVSMKE